MEATTAVPAKPVEQRPPALIPEKARGGFPRGKPTLRFSVRAKARLHFIRDRYSEEIAAFGISDPADPLSILDIWIPRQEVSGGSFEFNSEDIADALVDFHKQGFQPCDVSRVWFHTHPAGISGPSGTDEQTFEKVFGNFSWSVMAILPKCSPAIYAALVISPGFGVPGLRLQLDESPDLDFSLADPGLEDLKKQVEENVRLRSYATVFVPTPYESLARGIPGVAEEAAKVEALDDGYLTEGPIQECDWCSLVRSTDIYGLCEDCREEYREYLREKPDYAGAADDDRWWREECLVVKGGFSDD